MSYINKVIIAGNIGRDPELEYTPNGVAVANVSIATSRRYTDQSGAEKEETTWHRVAIFGRLAEIAKETLRKGSKVCIEGRLHSRSYETKGGYTRKDTYVIAERMVTFGARGGEKSDTGASERDDGIAGLSEDIPF